MCFYTRWFTLSKYGKVFVFMVSFNHFLFCHIVFLAGRGNILAEMNWLKQRSVVNHLPDATMPVDFAQWENNDTVASGLRGVWGAEYCGFSSALRSNSTFAAVKYLQKKHKASFGETSLTFVSVSFGFPFK